MILTVTLLTVICLTVIDFIHSNDYMQCSTSISLSDVVSAMPVLYVVKRATDSCNHEAVT
jgi:hypothetical protein